MIKPDGIPIPPEFSGFTTMSGIKYPEHVMPPKELVDMVQSLKYKEGWTFEIFQNRLSVRVYCADSTGVHKSGTAGMVDNYYDSYLYDRDIGERVPLIQQRPFYVVHTIEIPPSTVYGFNEPKNMRRWLLDQIINIETHEACEFFDLPVSGKDANLRYKPFFPHSEEHGVYAIVDKTPE